MLKINVLLVKQDFFMILISMNAYLFVGKKHSKIIQLITVILVLSIAFIVILGWPQIVRNAFKDFFITNLNV